MPKITSVVAREIINSRGDPTLECAVVVDNGVIGIASIPSGAAVGDQEAVELRDQDGERFQGKGVLRAVHFINQVIGPALVGANPLLQIDIDHWLLKIDTSSGKSRFGSNSLYAVSLAVCRAGAITSQKPLYRYIADLYLHIGGTVKIQKIPTPIFNLINGGKHGAGNLDFQEFNLIPASTKSFPDAYRISVELYHQLKNVLVEKNAIHSVGDEGGYAPDLYSNLDALEIVLQAVKQSQYRFGSDVFIGLDIAASYFCNHNRYKIRDRQNPMDTKQFINYLIELNKQYHLLILEDPLTHDDWDGWKELYKEIGNSVLLVGDDLLITSKERLLKAVKEKACSSILIKPNQTGTITETLEVVHVAQQHGIRVIFSHRSGETNDDFIADFAVGVQSEYVKFGAPCRGERVAKYNRLLTISSELSP